MCACMPFLVCTLMLVTLKKDNVACGSHFVQAIRHSSVLIRVLCYVSSSGPKDRRLCSLHPESVNWKHCSKG